MKKKILLISLLFVIFPDFVLASQAKSQGGQQVSDSATRVQQSVTEESPVVTPATDGTGQGNQVQVQNQQQNAGEEYQIQNQTATSLGSETAIVKGLHQNLISISELIEEPELKSKLNQMASEQLANSYSIEEEISKAQSRGSFARFLIGPNYYALKEVKRILEQNQVRIRELEILRLSLENQKETSALQTCIQNLESVDLMLNNQLREQTQSLSLFGWLMKWMAGYN